MSDEIKAGDIRISAGGNEIEVLAVDSKHLWGKWDSERKPRTHTLIWMHDWTTPKPTFFEVGKSYKSPAETIYYVHVVLEIGSTRVAVATVESDDNHPLLLREGDFNRLTKVE